MPETDPNELIWMKHDTDGYSVFPAYAVANREDVGWKKITKAEAKKAGYVLPGDLEPSKTSTAQEG